MKIRQKHIGGAAVAFVVLAMLMGYTTSQLTIYGTSVQNPVDVNATNIIDAPLIQQGGKSLNQTIDDREKDTLYTSNNGVVQTGTIFSLGLVPWDNMTGTAPELNGQMENITDLPTCGAGDFTTSDGTVFTCATPTDTTYTAGNGVTLVGVEFSAGTATTLNLTDLPTCGAGDFTTSDGSVFTCDTPAGGGAGQPNIDTANITGNDGPIPVDVTLNGDLAVNGDDITSDGGLTITSAGGNTNIIRSDDATHTTWVQAGAGGGNDMILRWRPNGNASNEVDLRKMAADDARHGLLFTADSAEEKIFSCLADSECSLGTTGTRWANLWADSINGADIGFLNGVTMVECVNEENQLDICFVYGDLTEDQIITRSIAKHKYFGDYLEAVNYEDFMTGQEFNSRKESITVDGKLDLTMGRTVHMSMRDVKKAVDLAEENSARLTEIEATLCNNGIQKYC